MKQNTLIAAIAAFALGGAVGGAAGMYALLGPPLVAHHDAAPAPPHPDWKEVEWPFPGDQWGKGKAFRCEAADCGTVVDLYVRPKLGSCNCTTGVANDEDLDRMSDLELLGDKVSPLAEGRPVQVGWMKGRSRSYALADNFRSRSAISVVLNDHCDMIVATVVIPASRPVAIESSVIDFLNSKPILHWAELELGI
jgi:hypothetical protein